MSPDVNRREAFRLDDTMMLSVTKLSDSEVNDIEENFDSYRLKYCLNSHFALQRENRKPNLLMIRKRDPDVGQFLDSMEEQLLLIASRLSESSFTGQGMTTHEVNLSNSSVRYSTAVSFEVGEQVQLQMILSTNDLQVFSLATVTRIEQNPEVPTEQWVALQLTRLHEDDAEAVIRHMAKLQQLQLQARRDS